MKLCQLYENLREISRLCQIWLIALQGCPFLYSPVTFAYLAVPPATAFIETALLPLFSTQWQANLSCERAL